MRNGKYNMIVLDWQGRFKQLLNPYRLFWSLAFRAMPVPAAIVTIAFLVTRVTLFFMSAKGSSATLDNLVQRFYLKRGQLPLRQQIISEPLDNICQFKLSFH